MGGSWDCFNDQVWVRGGRSEFPLPLSLCLFEMSLPGREACLYLDRAVAHLGLGLCSDPTPWASQGFLAAGIAPRRRPLSLEASGSMVALSTSLPSESRWDVPQVSLWAMWQAQDLRDPQGLFQWARDRVKRQAQREFLGFRVDKTLGQHLFLLSILIVYSEGKLSRLLFVTPSTSSLPLLSSRGGLALLYLIN